MRIRILSVGALKRGALGDAAEEYRRRLRHYCSLEEVEVPVGKHRELDRRLEQEARALERHLGSQDHVLLLDREGKALGSPELAARLERLAGQGRSRVAFLIGGPDGLAPTLGARAAGRISFSQLTFPHQLFRVMLLEQLYRAFTIIRGEPYHK